MDEREYVSCEFDEEFISHNQQLPQIRTAAAIVSDQRTY